MAVWRRIERWLSWFPWYLRGAREAELERELRDHLDLEAEEQWAGGLSSEQAANAAHRALGNTLKIEEEVRRTWGFNWLETFAQDVHYALRMLRKSPGFTAVAVLTLVLGIGATTTMFSAVNAVLLQPMPYPDSNRLVYLTDSNPSHGWPRFSSAPANFLDWRARNHCFDQLVAYGEDTENVLIQGIPDRWEGLAATQGLFNALRVPPALGRSLNDADFTPGKEHVVVLSSAVWRGAFGGDPSVLGRSLVMDGNVYTIVGIMPSDFQFGGDHVLYWMPLVLDKSLAGLRGAHFLTVMGRLRDGVSVAQAQTEMTGIAAQLERQYPRDDRGWTVLVNPMREVAVREVHGALLMLLGAVGFILLIACANEANMLLSRAVVRRREMAMRMALGAGRPRIVRQLLTESVVLSLIGGVLGLLIAWASDRILAILPPRILPRASSIHVDARVLAFAFALALFTGVIFGLAPALNLAKDGSARKVKKDGTRGGLRRLLVVTEIAMAVVLMTGSGLLVRSFLRLAAVEPGFQTQSRLTFGVSLPQSRYRTPNQWSQFFTRARARLASLPGVQSVDFTSLLPLNGETSVWSLGVDGQLNDTALPSATYYLVSPGYLRDMHIPLLAGRAFNAQDSATAPHVCLINDFLASRSFAGQNPIGRRIRLGRNYDVAREIVGVVGSVKQEGLDTGKTFQVYEPFDQMPEPSTTFVVHTRTSALALVPAARDVITQLDPEQPIVHARTLEQYEASSMDLPRFRTTLLGVFAGLALALAVIGLYGMMSYSVTQRTREIGIRMALGAQRRDVLRMIVRESLLLGGAGIVLGISGALALTQLLRSLLFEVKPTDPMTFNCVALVMIAVALLGSYVPARRAMTVDPVVALRHE